MVPNTEVTAEPDTSLTVKALGPIQPKFSLSVAGVKSMTGLVPQPDLIRVVVPVVVVASAGRANAE